MRYRQEIGKTFYYVEVYKGRFNLAYAIESDDFFSRNCYKAGNYFLTKEEGEKAVRFISRSIFKCHNRCRATNDIKKER